MNVLYIGLARAIRLFDISTINPLGRDLDQTLKRLAARYNFGSFPKNIADTAERKGWVFKGGGFDSPRGVKVLVTVSLYTDGFVADTMSDTDDSTAFLDDLVLWLNREEGLEKPLNVRNGFLSQLVFQASTSLSFVNPLVPGFTHRIADLSQPADQIRRHFELGALNFWTADTAQLGAPAQFKVERKIGAPFEDNQYFSQAGMETARHIQLLSELESILGQGGQRND